MKKYLTLTATILLLAVSAAYADEISQSNATIETYNQAIELNPQDAEAYLDRGRSYDKKGEYDKAIDDYSKAIELDPQYAKAYHNRGLSYEKKGEYDKARKDFSKAEQLESKYA